MSSLLKPSVDNVTPSIKSPFLPLSSLYPQPFLTPVVTLTGTVGLP